MHVPTHRLCARSGSWSWAATTTTTAPPAHAEQSARKGALQSSSGRITAITRLPQTGSRIPTPRAEAPSPPAARPLRARPAPEIPVARAIAIWGWGTDNIDAPRRRRPMAAPLRRRQPPASIPLQRIASSPQPVALGSPTPRFKPRQPRLNPCRETLLTTATALASSDVAQGPVILRIRLEPGGCQRR